VLTLAFMLVVQAPDMGFQRGNHGWCSAGVLALIEHATPRNGFVGHMLEYVYPDGRHDYNYFDRYPVFFAAGMHALLNVFELSRARQIYVARQAMNVLHGLTLLFLVALLVELEIAPGIAVAAAALAACGKMLIRYRDMVHMDQAALLGFVGLLWAIARFYRTGNVRLVYVAASIAVLMGRGYASFAVRGTFWVVEAVRAVWADFRAAPRLIARSVQTRACLLAIALAGSCLAYNIAVEAHRRDVPIAEVGIVKSAFKRLTLDESFNRSKAKQLAWGPFTETIAARGIHNLQPYIGPDVAPKQGFGLWCAVAAVALVVGLFIASRKPPLRPPLLIASLAGLAWVFPMRGLTAFHDFTNMFLLSLTVVFMAGLLRFVPQRVQLLPALAACAFLGYCLHQRNLRVRELAPLGEIHTYDLARIEAQLKPGDAIEVVPNARKLINGVPYALGFLLPNQPIRTDRGVGTWLVTTKKRKLKHLSMTPDNQRVFLFRR